MTLNQYITDLIKMRDSFDIGEMQVYEVVDDYLYSLEERPSIRRNEDGDFVFVVN